MLLNRRASRGHRWGDPQRGVSGRAGVREGGSASWACVLRSPPRPAEPPHARRTGAAPAAAAPCGRAAARGRSSSAPPPTSAAPPARPDDDKNRITHQCQGRVVSAIHAQKLVDISPPPPPCAGRGSWAAAARGTGCGALPPPRTAAPPHACGGVVDHRPRTHAATLSAQRKRRWRKGVGEKALGGGGGGATMHQSTHESCSIFTSCRATEAR
jgi:hypothetical protein